MKRLPPAKRNQLIGVLVGTLGLICLVYFVLILPQQEKNKALRTEIGKETARLDQYEKAIKQKDETTKTLADLDQQLDQAEKDVASGDLYAWTYDTMRQFKAGYHVDIPTIGQPGTPGECDLIGGFPYKQVHFSLNGTAYYHDLGKFIADFENKFTHCRVVSLSADPVSEAAVGGEKLNFRLDIAALVKPNN